MAAKAPTRAPAATRRPVAPLLEEVVGVTVTVTSPALAPEEPPEEPPEPPEPPELPVVLEPEEVIVAEALQTSLNCSQRVSNRLATIIKG